MNIIGTDANVINQLNKRAVKICLVEARIHPNYKISASGFWLIGDDVRGIKYFHFVVEGNIIISNRVNGRCGAILADEMGLGKTLQCISIWTLQCQGPYGGRPVVKKYTYCHTRKLGEYWGKEFKMARNRKDQDIYCWSGKRLFEHLDLVIC